MLSLALDGCLLLFLLILLMPEFLDEVLVVLHLLDQAGDGGDADSMHPCYISMSVLLQHHCMDDIKLLSSGELIGAALLILTARKIKMLQMPLIISGSVLLLLASGSIKLHTYALLQLHLLLLLHLQKSLHLLSFFLDLLTDASYDHSLLV